MEHEAADKLEKSVRNSSISERQGEKIEGRSGCRGVGGAIKRNKGRVHILQYSEGGIMLGQE